jgi:hypothetical protein
MKAHIGVDADSGLVHTMRCTSGHVYGATQDAGADGRVHQHPDGFVQPIVTVELVEKLLAPRLLAPPMTVGDL